jgi:hypothetical protein
MLFVGKFAGGRVSADPVQLRQVLDMTASVGELRFRGAAMADAVEELGKATNQSIFVNWRALKASRITKELPVTLDLSGLPLDRALDRLLDHVGGKWARVEYTIDENVISISTPEDLSKNVSTRVYDVRRAVREGATRAKDMEAVIRRVEGIDPLSWQDFGGTAAVREVADSGQLVVTATPEIQYKIAEELRDAVPEDRAVNHEGALPAGQ